MASRSGYYVSNLSGEAEYKSFVPSPLPPAIEMSAELIKLLVDVHRNIARLNSVAECIPSVPLFISMYVHKEALMSSQIEGTQTTLEDVLDPTVDANVNRDVADVVNYVKATEYAIQALKTLPLCNRLVKDTHRVLMQGVRGENKAPGEFRKSQNWIGGQGSTLKNARYIPPNVLDMKKAMEDLEEYIHTDDEYDVLVRAALIHYQFETIHPI